MQAVTQAMTSAATALPDVVASPRIPGASAISAEAAALLQAARNKAFSDAQEGRLADGMQLLLDALTVDPHNHAVMSDIAALLLLAREFRHAADYAQRALEIVPDHGPSLYALGLALLGQGDAQQARAVLEQLQQGAPLHSLASEAPELLPLVKYELDRLQQAEARQA